MWPGRTNERYPWLSYLIYQFSLVAASQRDHAYLLPLTYLDPRTTGHVGCTVVQENHRQSARVSQECRSSMCVLRGYGVRSKVSAMLGAAAHAQP